MPLYKTITPNSQTIVKVWKISETFEELMAPLDLKPVSKERVLGMKSELHQKGFLSVRHLLREEGYTDQDLYYDENGKPHLKDGKYISVTHSFIFSAVIISNKEVGIDIEKQRDKITRIAYKFADYEFQYLSHVEQDYVRRLTIIWCIKESLYKLFAVPGTSFKDNFMVIPFLVDHKTTVAWINYDNRKYRYDSNFLEFEEFSLAYVIG